MQVDTFGLILKVLKTKFEIMRRVYKKLLGIIVIGIIQVSTVTGQNLVPDKPQGPAYDYFCTWAAQNYLYGWGKDSVHLKTLVTESAKYATDLMNEKWLTGSEGWLSFFPEVRSDLIFLLDDGYYVNGRDAMEIDESKFPSFTGTPEERLKKLNDFVKHAGWRGLGLWSRGIKSLPEAEERVKWSKAAKIQYWKVDGGDTNFEYVTLRNKIYPDLVLEHAQWPGISVFNNGPEGSLMANYAPNYLSHLENTDVVRIYDLISRLGKLVE